MKHKTLQFKKNSCAAHTYTPFHPRLSTQVLRLHDRQCALFRYATLLPSIHSLFYPSLSLY